MITDNLQVSPKRFRLVMDFYLVRHGTAKSESEDPQRPLSDRGQREVEEVGGAAAAKEVRISEILHSGKLRARQTAEILAQAIGPARGIRETRGLSPDDDPWILKAELDAAEEPLMLVGHLPHLGRLVSLLVAGDPDREIVDFPPAAVVCLSRAAAWEVKWTLSPQRV